MTSAGSDGGMSLTLNWTWADVARRPRRPIVAVSPCLAQIIPAPTTIKRAIRICRSGPVDPVLYWCRGPPKSSGANGQGRGAAPTFVSDVLARLHGSPPEPHDARFTVDEHSKERDSLIYGQPHVRLVDGHFSFSSPSNSLSSEARGMVAPCEHDAPPDHSCPAPVGRIAAGDETRHRRGNTHQRAGAHPRHPPPLKSVPKLGRGAGCGDIDSDIHARRRLAESESESERERERERVPANCSSARTECHEPRPRPLRWHGTTSDAARTHGPAGGNKASKVSGPLLATTQDRHGVIEPSCHCRRRAGRLTNKRSAAAASSSLCPS
jgi:hypothetical protein